MLSSRLLYRDKIQGNDETIAAHPEEKHLGMVVAYVVRSGRPPEQRFASLHYITNNIDQLIRQLVMLNTIRNNRRAGFTLVEIMIVVAIIALLAAIAVPGFLRSRKRSQATAILNDARILDGAIDQYAIETNQKSGTTITASTSQGLLPYLKDGSRLYSEIKNNNISPKDIIGNTYTISTFDKGVKIATATRDNFTDVIENGASFWGAYYVP